MDTLESLKEQEARAKRGEGSVSGALGLGGAQAVPVSPSFSGLNVATGVESLT